jgi:WD40 repeat protein
VTPFRSARRYGERGWTRLEAMSFYSISTLKQVETPEIWVAAGDGASFLQRFSYVLAELPSKGVLFSEGDRQYIKTHEDAFLREMRASVVRNGYITKHGGNARCVAFHPTKESGLVASCGDDCKIKLVDRETGTAEGVCGPRGRRALHCIQQRREQARERGDGQDGAHLGCGHWEGDDGPPDRALA